MIKVDGIERSDDERQVPPHGQRRHGFLDLQVAVPFLQELRLEIESGTIVAGGWTGSSDPMAPAGSFFRCIPE